MLVRERRSLAIGSLFLREDFPPDHEVRQWKSRPKPVHAFHSDSADAPIPVLSKSRVSLDPHETGSDSQQVSTAPSTHS